MSNQLKKSAFNSGNTLGKTVSYTNPSEDSEGFVEKEVTKPKKVAKKTKATKPKKTKTVKEESTPTHEPPVADTALEAALAAGKALAVSRFGPQVYTADIEFLEAYKVRHGLPNMKSALQCAVAALKDTEKE